MYSPVASRPPYALQVRSESAKSANEQQLHRQIDHGWPSRQPLDQLSFIRSDSGFHTPENVSGHARQKQKGQYLKIHV
jgi:hypothetical protein